jgi:hypothetical protein
VAVDADFTVIDAVQTTFVAKLVIIPLIGTMVLAASVELDTVDPSESLLTTISVITPAVGILEVTEIFTSCEAPSAA